MAIPALCTEFTRSKFPLLRDRLLPLPRVCTCLEHLVYRSLQDSHPPPGTGLISVSIQCHSMAASAVMFINAHGIIYHGKGLYLCTDTTKKLRAIGLVNGDST